MNKHIRKLELLHRIRILATMGNYSPVHLRYMDAGDEAQQRQQGQ